MKHDIVVIGAGPAGLSFACALADTDLNILVVEKLPEKELSKPAVDGRDIALTHLSVRIMRELGAWARTPAESISPIMEAKVLDGDSPYSMTFDNRKASVEPLGYLVPNHLIRKALWEQVQTVSNASVVTDVVVTEVNTDSAGASVSLSNGETAEASLVVAADSRFSESRRKQGISARMRDFGRVAIVCRMEHEQPHNGMAFECFHYGRTLAILPLPGNNSSIVITVSANVSREIMSMSEEQFNADIQRRFENRLGSMKLIGERYPYPLVSVHADKFAATRYTLIGDAAVGMHPVTAHGFNLGLRGQDTLAREIRHAISKAKDIGAMDVLKQYESKHMRVSRPLYFGTNAMVSMFTNDIFPARILRKLVLRIANNVVPVKNMITNTLTEMENSPWPHLPFSR